jgi:hypothetical protein
MAALLSMTTHAHLASRAFLALALLRFSTADLEGGVRNWVATGALIGLTFLCRPLETVFLTTPLAAYALIQTMRRAPEYRGALPGLILGFLPFVALLAWHSYAMTGNPLLPPRFASPEHVDVTSSSLWARFGNNLTYNLLMLAVWFLGPIGVCLVAAGVLATRFTRLLGMCVAADLSLALFHDNSGLHIVGPIHYSECAVPLLVVAVYGIATLVRLTRDNIWRDRVRGALAMSVVPGLVIVTVIQAVALRQQALLQRGIYEGVADAVRDPAGRRAVVLTPWFFAIVNARPDTRELGTWVHDWRRPALDLSDDVLYLRDAAAVPPDLRRLFPDRRFFRLQPLLEPPFVAIVPFDGGSPQALELKR